MPVVEGHGSKVMGQLMRTGSGVGGGRNGVRYGGRREGH